jgi:TolB-like protein/DNA-binding winged helix-turn-helix (wHTH) protein/Flp pilus assembly protein TadD
MNAPPVSTYEFGDFRLDAEKRILWQKDARVPLTPRVFETLLYMLEHRDAVLDKERLMEAIWPDSIVEENNLTQNISTLRRIFGESPGSHRFIVTVPGRGYRFVAEVRSPGNIDESSGKSLFGASDQAKQPNVIANSEAPSQSAFGGREKLLMLTLALVVIGVFMLGRVFVFRMRESPPAAKPATTVSLPAPALEAKSIAVLPFENLSNEPANAYFASGIQEEILSNLTKIADLKVISRTSANLYKSGSPRNAYEIGQQLGVAHLLEGSVQRSGEHLRVHAQLIDTRTDSHLWAQTYDREVADIFVLQSEIAQTIAAQLQAKITLREKGAIALPPTKDPVAIDLYLRAMSLEDQPPYHENLLKAAGLLEQAVIRDRRFFLAYCALARVNLILYTSGYDHTVDRLEMANAAVQKAADLQPEAGEVHLVRARYFGLGMGDYDRARTELELARRTLPNNPAVYCETALLDRRQGGWTEAVENFSRAIELDPRNVELLENAAATYTSMRRYPEALRLCRLALAISPHEYYARTIGPFQLVHAHADCRPLHTELNAILTEEPGAAPLIAADLFRCAILERDSTAADRALTAIPLEGIAGRPGLVRPREWFIGYAARTFSRPEIAREAFEATRAILEKLVSDQPDHASAWSLLGQVEASLGRKAEAIKAGRRACEALPLSREPTSGLRPLLDLGKIYAWVGEKDLALQELAVSAEQNMGVSYGELKLDPDWDPLRGDPRFEKIVASLAPKSEGAEK